MEFHTLGVSTSHSVHLLTSLDFIWVSGQWRGMGPMGRPDVRALDQSTVFDAFSAFLTVVTRVNSVLDIPWVN